jgi:hypothetical protein
MDQKLWVFEIFRRSLAGRACARANEEELTTCAKFWGQEVGGRGQGECKKRNPRKSGQRPLVAGRASARSGWRPVVACRPWVAACTNRHRVFLKAFLDSFLIIFLRPLHVARAWASWGVGCTTPHFLKLAPILGSANSSKIHGEWRFHFFPKIFFPKFKAHLDLHIYH